MGHSQNSHRYHLWPQRRGPKNIYQIFIIVLALWMLLVCLIELITMWQNCIFMCRRFISWNARPPFCKVPVIPSGYPLGLTGKEISIKISSRSLHTVKYSKVCFMDSGLGLAPPHTGPSFEGVNQCCAGIKKVRTRQVSSRFSVWNSQLITLSDAPYEIRSQGFM